MDSPKELNLEFSNIDNTCRKCVYGCAFSPDLLCCGKFAQKPNEVYFGGQECPEFKPVGDDQNGK